MDALPGVASGASRFGSGRPAWTVGRREFAHLHSDSLIDLRLPRAIQKTLRGDPRAHFRPAQSDWVELEFLSAKDVDDVIALARGAAEAAKQRV
jgi:hypothetical protein